MSILLKPNYTSSTSLGLKQTLFNQSGGSGSFYQGDGGEYDEDAKEESPTEDRDGIAIIPPIDPQTIQLIDINDLIFPNH